ncbi:RHS repeat-associated core domain-containing protein [Streptomyces carminius]|uniref:RHS repeat-associated core domain-containing protein n=1 Tax=Streptomyces carminius TaxID=2665496 RepID=UPI001E52AAC9|nr:RHS repeat-associated core domain-containing protein [Streptomyces carminius]
MDSAVVHSAAEPTARSLLKNEVDYYAPHLGRFTQPDPSGQETNPYLYATGDPVNHTDPTGLYSWDDFTGDITVISGLAGTGAAVGGGIGCLVGAVGGPPGCGAAGGVGVLIGGAYGATAGIGLVIGRHM